MGSLFASGALFQPIRPSGGRLFPVLVRGWFRLGPAHPDGALRKVISPQIPLWTTDCGPRRRGEFSRTGRPDEW